MAYIPNTYIPITESKRKKVRYTLPTGGVHLSVRDTAVSVGKCENILNFDILSDRIKTRSAGTDSDESLFVSGNLNGLCKMPYYDKVIFHAGSCLYAFNPLQNVNTLIADTLPDKRSLMCHFMSKLYIYCNTHIYSIDSEFNFKEEEEDIYAPLLYENLVYSSSTTQEKIDTPFNLAAPRITVSYKSTTSKTFFLPHALDTTRRVEIYKDDVLVEDGICEIYEDKIKINDSSAYDNNRVVKVVYFLLNPEDAGYEDFIGNCRLVTAFGGNAGGGTRLFFMGNSEKKGYYYKSELQNPLHVVGDEYEVIGDGCEDITAVKKMYGDLIIFTENSVFKMSYNFTNDGTYFSVKELSSEAGCDCPESVQLIDNRIVFANSKRGIFIIDSTEEAGEQNIKPIAGNILKGKGVGLLDNTAQGLVKADSCDYDRKYMLLAGGKAYIWDYDITPYYESGSYSAAQERLCWYIYDGIVGEHFVNAGGRIVSFYEKNGVYLYTLSETADNDVESALESGMSECFSPLVRKHITGMSIKLSRKAGCEISLSLYGDGEKYYEVKLPERKKEKEKLILRLPKKALYGFGFSLSGKGAYEIEEIVAEYIEISE